MKFLISGKDQQQNLRHMALQKLFGLAVESVSKWFRIGDAEGVNIREAIIPGAPGVHIVA